MGIRETFRIALRAIRRNKVRSALTMLGVIIGVASVIAMIALGSGARAVIDEQIQSQGTTLIYLSAGSFGGTGPGPRRHRHDHDPHPRGRRGDRSRGPHASACGRRRFAGGAQVIAGNNNWNTSIEGGNEDFLAVRNFAITERGELHRPRRAGRGQGLPARRNRREDALPGAGTRSAR